MKNLLFLFAMLLQLSSWAQIQKVWDRALSGSDIEDPVFVHKNALGGVDVIAKMRGQGFDNDVAYGEHDYWFCRLNKSGQIIPGSNRTYGGSGVDFCKSAVKATDGGYLICGVSFSGASGNKTGAIPANNNSVLWIVKIDSVGTLMWQKQIGFNGTAGFTGSIDFYRGPIACNTTSGYAIVFNTKNTNNSSSANIYSTYVVTLDAFGNLGSPHVMNIAAYPQNNTGQAQNNINPRFITQLSSGNLLVTGYGHPAGDGTKREGVAILCNAGGTQQSFKTYTSSGPCEIISVREISPGGDQVYFAKSQHNSTAGFSRTVSSKSVTGQNDIWVFKTDNAWTLLGSGQNAIGSGGEILPDNLVIQCSNNGFYSNSKAYIFLQAQNTGYDRAEAGQGGYDYWLVEYDYTLNAVTKEKSFGGSGTELAKALFVDANSAFLFGNSNSPLSGDKTEALKAGTYDLWVVKACLGVTAATIANALYKHANWFLWPCEGSFLTVSVNNVNPDYVYKWYDAATGGNLLGTGTAYALGVIASGQTTTIWVEAANRTCTVRTKVNVSSIKTPPAPTITGSTVICPGATLSLNGVMNTIGQPAGSFYKFRWYNSSMQFLTNNTTYTQTNCTSNFTLYLSVIDSLPANPTANRPLTVCESPLTTINVVIDNAPAPIISYTNPICIYNTTALSVTNSSGYTVNWFNSIGNQIGSGNPFPYTNSGMTDQLSCEMVSSLASCHSVKTSFVVAVQHASPAVPMIQNTYPGNLGLYLFPTCSNFSAVMSVQSPVGSQAYKWYDAPTGGNLVNTGTSNTIPNVVYNGTYQYWVLADDGTCISTRRNVKVNTLKTPGAPQITTPTTNICKGDNLVLNATLDNSTQAGGIFILRWYNSANQLIKTGNTLVVPNMQSTATFYCAEVDSIPFNYFSGLGPFTCEGPKVSRQVTVEVVPDPIVPFTNPACIYMPTTLSVTNASGYTVKWYNPAGTVIQTGTSFIYQNSKMSDTVLCDMTSSLGCKSQKITLIINVQHVSPVAPTFQNTYTLAATSIYPTCSNTSGTINVKFPVSSYTYNWYDASAGGNLVNTGNSNIIPSVNYNSTYEYWVSAYDGVCISNRANVKVKPIKTPGLPKVISTVTHLCQNDTLVLIAKKDTSTQPGGTFFCRWYNASNQLLHTGDTLRVPKIKTTSTYYCAEVDSIPYNYFPNLGPYICEGSKVSWLITVDSTVAPVLSYTNPTCIYNSTTLSASNIGSNAVNWYDLSGNNIHAGNPFIYTNTNNADTIFCEFTSSIGCKSNKTPAVINIQHVSPSAPSFQNTYAQSGTEIMPTCSNSSAVISVKLPNSNYNYYWFDAPALGNIVNVGTANNLSTINYNSNYEYWVSANDGTCISDRKQVKIKPLKTPGLPQIQGVTSHICRYDTLILVASKDTSTQAGGSFLIRWYNASNQLLHTGDTLIVPNISNSGTYYCAEVDSIPFNYFPNLGHYSCEGPKTSRLIVVDTVANPIVSIPFVACTNTNIPLTVTNAASVFISWYNASGGLLSNSISYTIPHINSTDTIYTQATGLNSCKSKKVQSIIIPQKPTADFMSPKTLLNSGDIIQFTNQSTGGNTWQWNFGDGSFSTSKNAWHYFYNPGFYNISLITTSSVGCADTITKSNYIQVGSISGVSEYSLFKDVKIYPNPFSDGIRINVPSSFKSVHVSIYDLTGKELGTYILTGEQFLPLQNLNSGVYILKMATDDETLNIKIVKE